LTIKSTARIVLLTAAILTLLWLMSEKPHPRRAAVMPTVEPGMNGSVVQTTSAINSPVTLWVFLPPNTGKKIGCVIIAPSGTPQIWGADLGNTREYFPYVRAGFAVVAYSLDGSLPDGPSADQILDAHRAFAKAGAGVEDARAAIDYIHQHIPQVDPTRIYTAGHSSAGAEALLVAATDRRIHGCLAYCPPTDLIAEHGGKLAGLQEFIPDIRSFLINTSPSENIHKLSCPVFLFASLGDQTITAASVDKFATKLKRENSHVSFVRVNNGGHYESMINDGVPRGIEWLKSVDEKLSMKRNY
jgi:dipeptidyl aminopeptidase/acylaminoacyl peptidase